MLRRYRLGFLWAALGVATYGVSMVSPSWATIPVPFVWLGLTASLLWRASRRVEAHHVAAHRAAERTATLERHQRFMHDVSHELRTPVTIARGHLELVLRGAGGQRDVEVALDELSRVDAAVRRLLLLASAQESGFLVRHELELGPFLEDVLMRWSGAVPRAWRLGPIVAGCLRADPGRLRTALDALLENAVKYSPPGTAIELRARACAPALVAIEVADEGPGVPAQALERIFERFARADTAHVRSAGGVGLGLAIVDAIAKRHGGRCTVTSTQGGSVFGLELPEFSPAPDGGAQLAEPALS
jgi:signal transduction histidine kinase